MSPRATVKRTPQLKPHTNRLVTKSGEHRSKRGTGVAPVSLFLPRLQRWDEELGGAEVSNKSLRREARDRREACPTRWADALARVYSAFHIPHSAFP